MKAEDFVAVGPPLNPCCLPGREPLLLLAWEVLPHQQPAGPILLIAGLVDGYAYRLDTGDVFNRTSGWVAFRAERPSS